MYSMNITTAPLANYAEEKTRTLCYLRLIITSKQIKLDSPGWSGFVTNSKPVQPRPSSLICSEVMMELTLHRVRVIFSA